MWKNFRNRKKAEMQLRHMMTTDWTCSSCKEIHSGLFDLAAFAPDFWSGEEIYAPNKDVKLDGDFLSEDFCVIDGNSFFVRCVLQFPIKNFDHNFGFGVWSSLSKDNFKRYLEGFDDGNYEPQTTWSSWFSNRIKGIDDVVKQECWVVPQSDRKRPLIYLMDDDHPVSIAQEHGMAAEWLLEIFAANGHST